MPKRDIPYVVCILDVKGISKCKGVDEFTLPTELLDGYVAMPKDDYIDYVTRCEINNNKVKKLTE